MELNQLILSLEREKQRLFKSPSQSDKGRFYVVNKMIQILGEFETGYDKKSVDTLLTTIGKISVSQTTRLSEVLTNKIKSTPNTSFKIPVFPISMHTNINEDLIVAIYNELYQNRDGWLFSFTKEAIDNFALVKNWKQQLMTQATNDTSTVDDFHQDTVFVFDHQIDSRHSSELEAHILDYITRSNLPHEAKLPAFQFICRSGGTNMCSLLGDVFNAEFSDMADWNSDKNKKVDWIYDEDKKPICKTEVGVNLIASKQINSVKDTKIQHDPRIFSMNLGLDKNKIESDLKIKSNVYLRWIDKVIVPDVQDIILTGRHSNLMPLLYRF